MPLLRTSLNLHLRGKRRGFLMSCRWEAVLGKPWIDFRDDSPTTSKRNSRLPTCCSIDLGACSGKVSLMKSRSSFKNFRFIERTIRFGKRQARSGLFPAIRSIILGPVVSRLLLKTLSAAIVAGCPGKTPNSIFKTVCSSSMFGRERIVRQLKLVRERSCVIVASSANHVINGALGAVPTQYVLLRAQRSAKFSAGTDLCRPEQSQEHHPDWDRAGPRMANSSPIWTFTPSG